MELIFKTQKMLYVDMHLRRRDEATIKWWSFSHLSRVEKANKRPEVEGENRIGKERMFFFPLQLFPLIFIRKQSWWTQHDTKKNVTKVIPKKIILPSPFLVSIFRGWRKIVKSTSPLFHSLRKHVSTWRKKIPKLRHSKSRFLAKEAD